LRSVTISPIPFRTTRAFGEDARHEVGEERVVLHDEDPDPVVAGRRIVGAVPAEIDHPA